MQRYSQRGRISQSNKSGDRYRKLIHRAFISTEASNNCGEERQNMSSASSTLSEPIDIEAAKVAAAKEGDASCFEELVRRNETRIFRLALGITRNQEDAEDALQESFIKAYRYLDKFRGDSRFSTWLTRIALNEALMTVRRRRPNHVEFDETNVIPGVLIPNRVGEWGDNPEKRFAKEELREILFEAIQKL